MEKFRSDRLGIEIEIARGIKLEIKETRSCIRVSYKNKRIATILSDSKVEFPDINHIVCYKGRIVAYGNAYVEVGGLSRVFAKDESYIMAYQGAEVRANGRVKVRAFDNSRVIAGGRAKVFLEDKSIGYRKVSSRAKMYRLDSRVVILDINY